MLECACCYMLLPQGGAATHTLINTRYWGWAGGEGNIAQGTKRTPLTAQHAPCTLHSIQLFQTALHTLNIVNSTVHAAFYTLLRTNSSNTVHSAHRTAVPIAQTPHFGHCTLWHYAPITLQHLSRSISNSVAFMFCTTSSSFLWFHHEGHELPFSLLAPFLALCPICLHGLHGLHGLHRLHFFSQAS